MFDELPKKIGYVLINFCYDHCMHYSPCPRVGILSGRFKLKDWLPHLTEQDKQFLGIQTKGVMIMPKTCTSNPPRTYGDEVCPSEPGEECGGCVFCGEMPSSDKKAGHKCGTCTMGHWYSRDYTYTKQVTNSGGTTRVECKPHTHYCIHFDERKREIASEQDFDPDTAPDWCPLFYEEQPEVCPSEPVNDVDTLFEQPAAGDEEKSIGELAHESQMDAYEEDPEPEPPAATTVGQGAQLVPIEQLYPNPANPRKRFDEEELDKLTASVRQLGILSPILVVSDGEKYRIVAGERRYRAATAAGLKEVPVIVRELTEEQEFEVMLTENIQRQDLDPIEEAQAFKAAVDRGWKQTDLAEKLGISQAQVANRLRLLKLPTEVQENISREIISAGHGLELVRIAAAPALVKRMAKEFAERHVPIREASGRIDNEISGTHSDSAGRPLYITGRYSDAPKFDYENICLKPYESRRTACKYIVKAEPPFHEKMRIDRQEERLYCIHPECWDKRQKGAIDAEREAEMAKLRAKAEAAGKNPDKIKLPSTEKLDWNAIEKFSHYSRIQIEECAGCDKIIDSLGYNKEIIKICTDKVCWGKKVRAKENAQIRETKAKKRDFEMIKDAKIREIMETGITRKELIFIAAHAICDPATSTTWTSSKAHNAICEAFDLPNAFNCWWTKEKVAPVISTLQKMSDEELGKLIFFCQLRGMDESHPVFDLTLGTTTEEEVSAS